MIIKTERSGEPCDYCSLALGKDERHILWFLAKIELHLHPECAAKLGGNLRRNAVYYYLRDAEVQKRSNQWT